MIIFLKIIFENLNIVLLDKTNWERLILYKKPYKGFSPFVLNKKKNFFF